MDPHLLNCINEIKRKLEYFESNMFYNLYSDYTNNDNLKVLLSTLHNMIIDSFRQLNTRLPTGDYEAHFWAESSRQLITAVDNSFEIEACFRRYGIGICIDENYKEMMKKCRQFLCPSGGSTIPKNMEKIEIYTETPIFIKTSNIKVNKRDFELLDLKMIGSGSYADVFRFKDPFYNEIFALKRAKEDLSEKEKERFKLEYETLLSFNNPYIVKVYSFCTDKLEYTMEFLDCTMEEYIRRNNDKLTLIQRKSFINQFIKGLLYIHSKNKLHRDLSPRNIMLKKYDGYVALKITDFGLVKIDESDLTSLDSDVKGSFNDPSLKIDGFSNYNLAHEIYAATLICIFILTGKTSSFMDIKNESILNILSKGTNPNKDLRYKNVNELLFDISVLK